MLSTADMAAHAHPSFENANGAIAPGHVVARRDALLKDIFTILLPAGLQQVQGVQSRAEQWLCLQLILGVAARHSGLLVKEGLSDSRSRRPCTA